MARDFAKRFYKSRQWERTRAAYMRAPVETPGGRVVPPGMCERCFTRKGRLVPAEIVHHRTHLTPQNIDDPSVTMGFGNLERVCRDCHAELHYPRAYRPRLAFGSDGRTVKL